MSSPDNKASSNESNSSSSLSSSSSENIAQLEEWISSLNTQHFNSDQIMVLMVEKIQEKSRLVTELQNETLKKTNEIKWLCEKVKQDKRKLSKQSKTLQKAKKVKKENRVKEIACDDIITKVLEFLPNLQGFKLMLVSKQFLRAVEKLKSYHYDSDDSDLDDDEEEEAFFYKSKYFNRLQTINNLILTNSSMLTKVDGLLEARIQLKTNFTDGSLSKKSRIEKLQLDGKSTDYTVELTSFNLYNLQSLSLEKFSIFNNISRFVNNTTHSLRVLKVKADTIRGSLAPISFLPLLEELSIGLIIISSETKLFDIFNCQTLKVCEIATAIHTSPDIETPMINQTCPNLQFLSFTGKPIYCDIICNFKMPKLETLEMSGVTKRGAIYLSNNESLANLSNITFTSPKDDTYHLIFQNKFLTNLKQIVLNPQLDTESSSSLLFHLSNEASPFSLEKLKIMKRKSVLDGFGGFSSSTKFINLTELVISLPSFIKQLMYLAESKHFSKLKKLHISNTSSLETNEMEEIKNIEFISQLSINEAYRSLKDLKYYITDSDIVMLRNYSVFKLEKLCIGKKDLVTSIGYKNLCEWDIVWEFSD